MDMNKSKVERDQFSSKSILAKLLANENINVEHKNVSTAYFDLANRTLVCPTWTDMDGHLYDLVMGHEVGHALETPKEGWHDAVQDSEKKFKAYLNVLEDARIEKKIKRRYPGLARSFSLAYKELYERDFFGIKKLDTTDKLTLIDRLNIRFKIGAHVKTSFSAEEEQYLRATENLETWEQVVDLAKKIFAYSKEHEASKIKNASELKNELDDLLNQNADSADDDQELGDADDDDESTPFEDDDSTENPGSGYGGEEPSTDSDPDSDDPTSITDRIFRQREKELVGNGNVRIIDLPIPVLDNIIVKNSEFTQLFYEWMSRPSTRDHYNQHNITDDGIYLRATRAFNQKHGKYIQNLVQEFQRKKKAAEYNRQLTSKTGILDMDALHKYRFTNDLFKKVTTVQKGKNHGMIVYLDMSASMGSIFADTINQLMIFVDFCNKVNIPFEVYGFTDQTYKYASCNNVQSPQDQWTWQQNITSSNRGFFAHKFALVHLIGSSLSKRDFALSRKMLLITANEYSYGYGDANFRLDSLQRWSNGPFALGNTPMMSAIVSSRAVVQKFRNDSKVEIVNVVYLTDGEATDSIATYDGLSLSNKDETIYYRDSLSKNKIRATSYWQTKGNISKLINECNNTNTIGIFMSDRKRDALNYMRSANMSHEQRQKAVDCWNKNKFMGIDVLGYDKYFVVKIGEVDAEKQLPQNTKAGALRRAFVSLQKNKINNRVLANQIIDQIAS